MRDYKPGHEFTVTGDLNGTYTKPSSAVNKNATYNGTMPKSDAPTVNVTTAGTHASEGKKSEPGGCCPRTNFKESVLEISAATSDMLASAGVYMGEDDEQSPRGADREFSDTIPKADDGLIEIKQPENEDGQNASTCPEESRELPVEPINNQDGSEEDAEPVTALTLFSSVFSFGTAVSKENSVTEEGNQPETDDTDKEK